MKSKKQFDAMAGETYTPIAKLCEEDKAQLNRIEALLIKDIKTGFAALTDDQRMKITSDYCRACWTPDPKCQCWNDE